MEVEILHLVEGARAARGVVVVIDVFRAFTTACFAFTNGAADYYAVGDLAAARTMKAAHPDYILMGERHGAAPIDFDFGNSPAQIEHANFSGKTLVHTTSAGTQGLVNAVAAEEVIAGAFVNAGAIIRYLREKNPSRVSLVCMGREAIEPTVEDTACAEFIRNALLGLTNDFAAIRERIRGGESARKFFDAEVLWATKRDFELCLSLDRFAFILRAETVSESVSRLRAIHVPEDAGGTSFPSVTR